MKDEKTTMQIVKQTIEVTPVQPYTTKELAKIFNMSARTLRRNIAGIKILLGKKKMGYLYGVEQVQIIFDHMGGAPYEIIQVIKEIPAEQNLHKVA